ncbi:MAG: hypothetical protein ACKOFP_01775 [Actinomycetota bacterium]
MGAIINRTGQTIYISGHKESMARVRTAKVGEIISEGCSIAPGQRAAYAGNGSRDFHVFHKPLALGEPSCCPWRLANPSCFDALGVGAKDGLTGDPEITLYNYGFRNITDPWDRSFGSATESLGEGQRRELTNEWGTVTFIRHGDNQAVAREWTGYDDWAVNDWARIDFEINSLTPAFACL